MMTVHIRRQGGAAIITIPAEMLKRLDLAIGTPLELRVADGGFTAQPARPVSRRRYTLAELLRGATPAAMAALHADTAWAREGDPVGREQA